MLQGLPQLSFVVFAGPGVWACPWFGFVASVTTLSYVCSLSW